MKLAGLEYERLGLNTQNPDRGIETVQFAEPSSVVGLLEHPESRPRD